MTDKIDERLEKGAYTILLAAKEMRDKIPLSIFEQEIARAIQQDVMRFSLDKIRTMKLFTKSETECFKIMQAAMVGTIAALQACLDEADKMTKEGVL